MKKILKYIRVSRKKKMNRTSLERRVEQGTRRAVKEYRKAFERLAEYDRT